MNCKDCSYKKFYDMNGRPGRYYCLHDEAKFARSECEPHPIICRTARHDDKLTIKTAPRWCPLNKKEKGNDHKTNCNR